MANRRTSWRRGPSTQPHHRRSQKNQTTLPFSGIEDHAILTLFTHLLSKKVNVNAVNGAVYTGLFAGTQHSPNNDILLTLRFASLLRGKPVPSATVHDLRGTTASRITIPFSRVTTVLGAPLENNKAFVTDSQISRGSSGVGRQLQRFDDFANVQQPNSNTTLDQQTFGSLANKQSREKWDQFQVNQAKFGVTTSFDETQYTTTIDRNSKDFAQRQREADRLAEEIESTPSQNIHIREERNQDTGNDFDEEARYSGVQRPQSTQQPRPQPPAPERPRLSYAAAAAAAANVDQRQHLLSKPPSAGATHAASVSKSASTQTKNVANASKQSSTANSRHSQQSGKASQDQPAKHNQSASRGSHSASAKNAPSSGKVAAQTPKSVNKKGTAAANKPQQHQGKNAGANNKSSSQASGNKSASQAANARPSSQAVNTKTSGSAGHAKTPPASTRGTTPSQPGTSSQEQAQTKSMSKVTTPAQSSSKDKPAEDKTKPVVKERAGRDSLPQMIKVRAALTGRTSPNQSRNSPLPTPAVADTSAIGVLNLDAQTPNLGPEKIKSFEKYKTNREIQSIAANRDKITDDLKKFSTQLDSRNGSLRRGQTSGSSTPGTPRAAARMTKNIPESIAAEKIVDTTTKNTAVAKDATAVKEDVDKEKPHPEAEANVVKEPDAKPADKSEESAPRPRPKSKSKLNPNAQEFRLNPDAPSFTPGSQKTQPQSPAPYAMYNPPGGPVEYSPHVQLPPGYAVPIQALAPMPYPAPQPYVVVPTVPAAPVAGGSGSAYPFVQQPPSFTPAPVGARFPQSAGMPVSYGYPPQVAPVVIPPQGQQRVPTSPYYNSGPYVSAAPHQAHLYQQGAAPHLQAGNMSMGGRGPHGNGRRGGANRSRGKTSLQQTYPHAQGSGDRSAPKSPEGARSPGGAQR